MYVCMLVMHMFTSIACVPQGKLTVRERYILGRITTHSVHQAYAYVHDSAELILVDAYARVPRCTKRLVFTMEQALTTPYTCIHDTSSALQRGG